MITTVCIYLVSVNLAAFVLMGIDKSKARQHKWRIPEKTLFLFPILGGGLGGLAGMYLFHHKTKHPKFIYGFFLLFLAWTAALIFLLTRLI